MSFLDQMRGAAMPEQAGIGKMGVPTRPKTRYLDRVLMKQRDQKQAEIDASMNQMGSEPGAQMGPSQGPPPMPRPFGSLSR